ncbi:MAG: hypothetical protein JOZ62_03535, partial [Acidobacteriaceae bacterium]|nr:hypothetical protein [Acidobacteriaceae bacterium]
AERPASARGTSARDRQASPEGDGPGFARLLDAEGGGGFVYAPPVFPLHGNLQAAMPGRMAEKLASDRMHKGGKGDIRPLRQDRADRGRAVRRQVLDQSGGKP